MRVGLAVLVAALIGLWASSGVGQELTGAPPVTMADSSASDVGTPAGPASTAVPATSEVTPSTLTPSRHPLVAAEPATPTRLVIPVLGLDAEVVTTGVDADGHFAVPGPELVGWYEFGPVPGESGSSVLAAHVDWNGQSGAFSDLALLRAGDALAVVSEDGSTRTFEVVDQILYDKSALPASELFRNDGAAVLRLITCGGDFDRTAGHYLGNRVVTAVERAA